jgi:CPA2 family monovalent cation:H+ antiporter-2
MDATTTPILEIGIILLAAVAGGWLARRLGLPAIVGYLAVGLGFSPFTPGYVANHGQLEVLADVGVVLLLFEVGIEVDLARLRHDHGPLLWAAPTQAILTTVIASAALVAVGLAPIPAALVGLCVALSSSVVIVNITISKRRTTDRPTEEALLGWSVLQDLIGVALAAILLAAIDPGGRSLGEAALGLVGFGLVALAVAEVLPWVLRRLRDEHDLFLITSVGSGLALAGIGAAGFGVPLALAAFIGGLAVTESHDAAEARRRLRPFRDVFAVLFFVTIGTLIDPGRLSQAAPWLALLLLLVLVAKVGLAWVLARLAPLEVRPFQLAVGLGQIGEFSFVLASAAAAAGAIDGVLFTALIASVAISIAASSIAVRLVPVPKPPVTPVPGAGTGRPAPVAVRAAGSSKGGTRWATRRSGGPFGSVRGAFRAWDPGGRCS